MAFQSPYLLRLFIPGQVFLSRRSTSAGQEKGFEPSALCPAGVRALCLFSSFCIRQLHAFCLAALVRLAHLSHRDRWMAICGGEPGKLELVCKRVDRVTKILTRSPSLNGRYELWTALKTSRSIGSTENGKQLLEIMDSTGGCTGFKDTSGVLESQ